MVMEIFIKSGLLNPQIVSIWKPNHIRLETFRTSESHLIPFMMTNFFLLKI